MNDFLNEYLNKKVDEILGSNPDPSKKQALIDNLQTVILDTVIDNLTDEQVMAMQNIDPDSPEMEEKLEEYSATIPNLGKIIEEKLNQEIIRLKDNPASIEDISSSGNS